MPHVLQPLIFIVIAGMAMVTVMPHYSELHLISDNEYPSTIVDIPPSSSRNDIINKVNHHVEKRSPTLIAKSLFKKLLLLKLLKKLKLQTKLLG